jgi:hypothetical protein
MLQTPKSPLDLLSLAAVSEHLIDWAVIGKIKLFLGSNQDHHCNNKRENNFNGCKELAE